MKLFTRCFLVLVPLYLPLAHVNAVETPWTYQGNHDSKHWGEFGSALCTGGAQQSPIDVELKQVQLHKIMTSDLIINYKTSPVNLQNNGHTIQISVNDGGSLSFQDHEYKLAQYHFHTPSEHQINHLSFPMELHLVHQNTNGRLLVLGVMVKEGKKNTELALLWNHLPGKIGKEAMVSAKLAPVLNRLIPVPSHHFYYKGSLTTPPCTEGVQWILFEQPIEMSKSQIQKFLELFPDNHRPLQQLNYREVDED
ncbi:carbonic anhydrase [Pseudomonas zeae]|uniref:Carbonic anhydrase n=1 Tax=Pseudomonas zeae TaxID=2745510 RepID=A0A9E6TB47_9PSED|nr:carbonic anhydrase family protein [Pseudomonas zeae]QXI11259.1 carbonic anhydrase family protein [Pseudomonas zeae]